MKRVILLLILLYMIHDMPVVSVYYPSVAYASVAVLTFALLVSQISWLSFRNIIPFMVFPLINLFVTNDVLTSYSGWASVLQMFIYPLIALYLLQYDNKRVARLFFFVYVSFQIIICITTIWGLSIYPDACRSYAVGDFANSQEFVLYRLMNIGGYTFIYTLTVTLPLIVLVWRYGKDYYSIRKPVTFIALFFLLLCLYTIYKSQYTTALLFSVMAVVLSFIKGKLNAGKILLIAIIGLSLFGVLKEPIISGFSYFAGQIEGQNTQDRFNDLSSFLQGEQLDESSDVTARQDHWMKSVDTFLNHPLGAWSNAIVGGHSTWLDALARYGLFTLLFFFMILRGMKNYLLRPIYGTGSYNNVLVSLIMCLLLGVFNPSFNTDFMLFVLPLFLYVIADVNLLRVNKVANNKKRLHNYIEK